MIMFFSITLLMALFVLLVVAFRSGGDNDSHITTVTRSDPEKKRGQKKHQIPWSKEKEKKEKTVLGWRSTLCEIDHYSAEGGNVLETTRVPVLQEGQFFLLSRARCEASEKVMANRNCVGIDTVPAAVGTQVRTTVSNPHAAICCKDGKIYLTEFANKMGNMWTGKDEESLTLTSSVPLDELYGGVVYLGDHKLVFHKPRRPETTGQQATAVKSEPEPMFAFEVQGR